jgi:hypothetical protein
MFGDHDVVREGHVAAGVSGVMAPEGMVKSMVPVGG